jgi:hypothetical protein
MEWPRISGRGWKRANLNQGKTQAAGSVHQRYSVHPQSAAHEADKKGFGMKYGFNYQQPRSPERRCWRDFRPQQCRAMPALTGTAILGRKAVSTVAQSYCQEQATQLESLNPDHRIHVPSVPLFFLPQKHTVDKL